MCVRAVVNWLSRKARPAETSAALAVWFSYALGAELKPGFGEWCLFQHGGAGTISLV